MRKCERQGCEKVLPIDREKLLGSVALVVGHPLTLARRRERSKNTRCGIRCVSAIFDARPVKMRNATDTKKAAESPLA